MPSNDRKFSKAYRENRLIVLKEAMKTGFRCSYCRRVMTNDPALKNSPLYGTADHIIPYSKGGGDNVENLRACCADCNSRRGNKLEARKVYVHPAYQ